MKNEDARQYLTTQGWDSETSIIYKFNSHGFRTKEFDSSPAYLALGCSFTEGIGLREEQVWPSLLADIVNTPIWNLGIGGASLDTCYRLLEHYIQQLNLQGIFVLLPPTERFELHLVDGTVHSFVPRDNNNHNMIKHWVANAKNALLNSQKNLQAMSYICNKQNIPLYTISSWDIEKVDLARDMSHPGPESHKLIASKFNNLLNNI